MTPSIAGGLLLALAVAALAVAGLVVSGLGLALRQPLLLALGVLLLLPAPALLVLLLVHLGPELIPRTLAWDLSTDRRASRLGKTPVGDSYYFQGNLRTEVTLADRRRWAGRAAVVVFRRDGDDEIRHMSWQGQRGSLSNTYAEARRILGELRLDVGGLDRWHEGVQKGAEPTTYSIDAAAGQDPALWVRVRGYADTEKGPKSSWAVLVEAVWRVRDR